MVMFHLLRAVAAAAHATVRTLRQQFGCAADGLPGTTVALNGARQPREPRVPLGATSQPLQLGLSRSILERAQ